MLPTDAARSRSSNAPTQYSREWQVMMALSARRVWHRMRRRGGTARLMLKLAHAHVAEARLAGAR